MAKNTSPARKIFKGRQPNTKSAVVKQVKIAGKYSKGVKAKQLPAKQTKFMVETNGKSTRRAAGLKSHQVDVNQQAKIQKALYEIADAASAVRDMQSFYKKLHKIVGKLMYAENFFIALYDEQTDLISWPYFVDSTGDQPHAPTPLEQFKGGTTYVLRTGKIVHASRAQSEELYRRGEVEPTGPESEDWLGTPLKVGDKTLGILVVQSYKEGIRYTEQDVNVLNFVAQHIATALTRVRAIEETRQRNAELQIINSIQQGLAAELNFQAIVDLVGDKLREVLKTDDIGISWFDYQTNLLHHLYLYEHGQRILGVPPAQYPIKPDIPSPWITVSKTKQPLIFNTSAEMEAYGLQKVKGTDDTEKSAAFFPIIGTDRVIGHMALWSFEREYAYGEAEVRLLTTIANGMGVALENARLFDEVQKRNLEISEALKQQTATSDVLRAMSGFQPDLRSLLEIIAENIAKVCDANDAHIYRVEGEALKEWTHRGPIPGLEAGESLPLNRGSVIGRAIIDRQIIHIHDAQVELDETEYPVSVPLQRRWGYRTVLATPLLRDGEPIGGIAIRREEVQPFTDKQIELIKTFADQAVIAIENVRLFDETQRLLKDTQQRAAELSIINSIQQGLASKLELQAIIDLVGDQLRNIFDTGDIGIRLYDEKTDLVHFLYEFEHGERLTIDPRPFSPAAQKMFTTREPVVVNEDAAHRYAELGFELLPGTDMSKSYLAVPIIAADKSIGSISLENYEREHAYSDSDVRLLQTLAASMGVALQNARLFDETQRLFRAEQQRAAELAIINKVQEGLAKKLDLQEIVDLVGEKVGEIFAADTVSVGMYDAERDWAHHLYYIDRGQLIRLADGPAPRPSLTAVLVDSHKPLLIGTGDEMQKLGALKIPRSETEEDKNESYLGVPIMVEEKVIGAMSLQSYRQNAFDQNDLRLLQTLANAMSVALENARLFDEVQKRNQEITEALEQQTATSEILSVIAGNPTDVQPVLNEVAEKAARLCNSYDAAIVRVHGDRYRIVAHWGPVPIPQENFDPGAPLDKDSVTGHALIEGKILHIHDVMSAPEGEYTRSKEFYESSLQRTLLVTPLLREGRVIGAVVLRRQEVAPFTDKQISLLKTFADQAAIAIENVRLFQETSRLLIETEQRAAELAIITSVQAGLASKLDMQTIYDLVGDKVGETFNAEVVYIAYRDLNQPDKIDFPYFLDQGKRINLPPLAMGEGLTSLVITSKQPRVFGTRDEQIENGAVIDTGDLAQSFLGVPISIGENVVGVVSVQSYEINKYRESDIRLLTTLANAMSVALENARLFDETQRLLKETEQRAAELQIINSVQEGLASKLNIQAIYDLVGDKIQEIFDAQVVTINTLDTRTNLSIMEYGVELGKRLELPPSPFSGLEQSIARSRQTILIDQDAERRMAELGAITVPGTAFTKSNVFVPMMVGSDLRGYVSLQNVDRDNAFSESDVRLLQTLANSMSVALENARLFDETQRLFKAEQQRAAELAILNSVSEAMTRTLDVKTVTYNVGDKVREIFNAEIADILLYDPKTRLVHLTYSYCGRYFEDEPPWELGEGLTSKIILTRQPLLLNTAQEMDEHGAASYVTAPTDAEDTQSYMGVPIMVGDKVLGVVDVQSYGPNAFNEGNLRLLQTLSTNMGVALENARLFDETQRLLKETEQRAQELAIINSVQEALASKLDMQAIYDLVGDKIRDMFNAQSVIISSFDLEKQVSRLDYAFEDGQRVFDDELLPLRPLDKHLITTRQPVVINDNAAEAAKQYGLKTIEGTHTPKSLIYVPFGTGSQVNGYFSLQNFDRENAFTESDVRLLQTLAGSMGIAIENARLFGAERQRAAELAAISTVSQALVAETELDNMIQLIGSQMREIFEADIVYLALLDRQTNLIHFPYQFGEHFTTLNFGEGLTSKIIETGEPLLINKDIGERRAQLGKTLVGRESLSFLGVPIKSGREIIGVLSVQSTQTEGVFGEDSLRLLTTIAANAGAAIHTAQLHAETQRRAQEMATLAEIGNDIAASRDLEPVLERIAAHAKDILHVRDIAIYLREGNTLHVPVALGTYTEEIKSRAIELGEGITGNIAKTGIAELINDPTHDPRVIHVPGTPEEDDEHESLMVAPLISRGQTIGLLSVWRPHTDGLFTQPDLDFLISVARQTAIAIESARLYLETQRREREMSALVDVGREISASLDAATVLEGIARHAKDLLNGNLSALFLPEADGKTFRAIAAVGEEAEEVRNDTITLGEGLLGDIARSKVGEIVNDTSLDPRTILIKDTEEVPDEHLLSVPLLANDELKGLMAVWRTGKGTDFIEAELEFLSGLSRQAVIAVQNAQLFADVTETLEQQTATGEILRVIAESPTDIQPVMNVIAENAWKLCNGTNSNVYRTDGTIVYEVAQYNFPPEAVEESRRSYPAPLARDRLSSQAILDRAIIHIPDMRNDPDLPEVTRRYMKWLDINCFIVVPLMREGEAIGAIGVGKQDPAPFTDKQIALLQTFASQAVIAIENVRLFTETQHLLKETEQRAAELQIINSVQEGLASKLEVQAIYDLVGDKIRDIFHAQGTAIYLFNHETEIQQTPYCFLRERFAIEPHSFSDIARLMIDTVQPRIYRNNAEYRALGGKVLENNEEYKSGMYVPLIVGKEIRGMIGIASLEKENAYGDSDLRLLTTLANSMSVALESARLFDEVTQRKEYFEVLFQNNPVAVVTIDNEANVTSWNPAAEELFGYAQEEALGRNVDDLVASLPELHTEAVGYSKTGLNVNSDAFQVIAKRTRRDGSLVDVELSGVPIVVQNKKLGMYALYHDITELQRARQEAIAANEAKSSFLATMSHEIRTPMNAVIGMSGLLMDTPLNKEQRDYAETIRNSGDALLGIINDILDFSKIEAGKMDVEYQPFDLRECVESALDLTAGRAVEKGLDIAYIIDDDMPIGIKSDVTRLRQILINLLSNAIKFTEKGEVVLTVRKGKTKNELLFTVRDTGIGISESHMARLFQSFSQADSSTTRKFGGTGLGLAISKRLSEMMGGEMRAESAGVGKGSTFIFTIRAEPAKVAERKPSRDIKGIQSILHDKRVLIVDDNATNRRILVLQTEKWGMSARETEHPRQALEWLKEGERFDLAILDIQMPEMDGVMLTREIRKLQDEKALPIILLTSLGRREVGAEELNYAAYLTKPLKPSALYDALAGIFARSLITPRPEPAKAAMDAEIAKRHPLRILLAEDNQVNQKLALRILEQMGYRADVASNGLEAVESVERQVYDVILMDVQMPDMDGLEATRQIRTRGVAQPHIIGLTANAMEGDRQMCLEAGMNDYVAKPIRVNELVEALMKAERK